MQKIQSMVATSARLEIFSRWTATVMGGFIFAYGFVALATVLSFTFGLRFSEAWTLSNMLAFVVYLGALLWGFTVRRTPWVWLVLGGGGAAMSAAAWALSRLVP
jgi:hypothetical protein